MDERSDFFLQEKTILQTFVPSSLWFLLTLETKSSESFNEQSEIVALFIKERSDFKTFQYQPDFNAKQNLQKFIKIRKWNASRFKEKTGLTGTIFTKIQKNRYDDWRPSLPTIVAICIGLQIPYCCSEALLQGFGLCLTSAKEDVHFRFLLTHYEKFGIDSANEFLKSQGQDAVANKELYSTPKGHPLAKNVFCLAKKRSA